MAVTVDFGSCAQCGEKNSTAATKCRSCGAVLPWVQQKAPKPAKPVKAPVKAARAQVVHRDPFYARIDWGTWFMVLISFVCPPIGYFLYRSYAEHGDEKCGPVGWAALLGLIFWIVRLMVHTGSHTGAGSNF